MTPITCSDPLHATRSGSPGWAATLGFVADGDRVPTGYLCPACAAALIATSALQVSGPQDTYTIRLDGLVTALRWYYYPDGTPARAESMTRTAAWLVGKGIITSADVTAVKAVFAKIETAWSQFLAGQ